MSDLCTARVVNFRLMVSPHKGLMASVYIATASTPSRKTSTDTTSPAPGPSPWAYTCVVARKIERSRRACGIESWKKIALAGTPGGGISDVTSTRISCSCPDTICCMLLEYNSQRRGNQLMPQRNEVESVPPCISHRSFYHLFQGF